MSWLSNFVKPKIKALVSKKEVPDNLWHKCNQCEKMIFHRDLTENAHICQFCGYHFRIDVEARLKLLFDEGEYQKEKLPEVMADPLKFRDRKKYTERLKESKQKTNEQDAIIVAIGKIGGIKTVVAAFNFSFMGGSMGIAVGEALLHAARKAVENNAAFITIPASGGARMQEGILSLMQMPRSILAVEIVKSAKLPHIVILTDPTTGGVSASFAMVGDIAIAEPKAIIGFAGRRVIEETIRETLPDDFQTAEYLQEHGMVDIVVPRNELKDTLTKLLTTICQPIAEQNIH